MYLKILNQNIRKHEKILSFMIDVNGDANRTKDIKKGAKSWNECNRFFKVSVTPQMTAFMHDCAR